VPPRVSVLLPARNAAATVGEAVASVVAQTLDDWELIVVDDGSTDETAAIVRAAGDERVRVVRQAGLGVSSARNRAAREAHGELLAFLDADDRFAPEKLERQARRLAERPDVGSTYSSHRRIDADGVPWTVHVPPPELSAADLLAGFPFNPSVHVVRRAWHERAGGFDETLAENEDRDYWLRLLDAGCRFARTEGVLADYRLRRAGTPADWPARRDQALRVLDRWAPLDSRAAARGRAIAWREYALQAAAAGAPFPEEGSLTIAAPEDRAAEDDLLQAVVDLAVRSRGDAETLLERLFAVLDRRLQAERRWASGAAALLAAQRELAWKRPEAARVRLAEAVAHGAGWHERTRRLMRHQCLQFREAYGDEGWRPLAAALAAALAEVASRREVRRFLASIEGGPRLVARVAGWFGKG
jgi:glycosyltransferase involved in cell wall biosynthesis